MAKTDTRLAFLTKKQIRSLNVLTPEQRERKIETYLQERRIRLQVAADRATGLSFGDAVRGDPIAKSVWGL